MSVHGLERNQGYSGIEVVSSNAPERAYSQHAPERYFPYSDPQVSYDHSPPLVDHAQGNELPEKALPSQPGPPDPQPKEKGVLTLKIPKKWLLLACAIVILLGIALGVGLGVGLTRKNEQSTPTDSSSNESPSTSVPPSEHAVLRNTSLVAVSTFEGGRRVFYQENTGVIRMSTYIPSANVWTSSIDANVTETPTDEIVSDLSARNNTPLSAVTSRSPAGADLTYLFYISVNGSLCWRELWNGRYEDSGALVFTDFPSLAPKPDSRSLSASIVPGLNYTTQPLHVLLTYELVDGNITMLYGINRQYSSNSLNYPSSLLNSTEIIASGFPWEWRDVSPKLFSTSAGSTFAAPFASAPVVGLPSGNDSLVMAAFFDPVAPAGSNVIFIQYEYFSQTFSSTLGSFVYMGDSVDGAPPNNRTAVLSSDFIIPTYYSTADTDNVMLSVNWVNGTRWDFAAPYQISPPEDEEPGSDTYLPYPKITSTTVVNKTESYYYHQVSDTIIQEELLSSDGGYIALNITIEVE